MEDFRFHFDLRVRWSEVDPQGIVYNPNYMMYVDLAYGEYAWRTLQLWDALPPTVLAKSTVQFRASAKFDDDLKVWVRTKRIGNSSFVLVFCITRDGPGGSDSDVIFEAESVYVHVDLATGESRTVPDAWREKMVAYEIVPIEGV
jgi:acyl-CoA thioester hydrolase